MGVWSYDFVEVQTHDGRRLMTLIDEFTRSPPFERLPSHTGAGGFELAHSRLRNAL
jgi:hypothetical protein